MFLTTIEIEVAAQSQPRGLKHNKYPQELTIENSAGKTSSDLAEGIISSYMLLPSFGATAKLTKVGTEETASSASSRPLGQDENNNAGHLWEVVESPNSDETTPDGFSSHFDITLGWGKWKFTLFSWDMKITY